MVKQMRSGNGDGPIVVPGTEPPGLTAPPTADPTALPTVEPTAPPTADPTAPPTTEPPRESTEPPAQTEAPAEASQPPAPQETQRVEDPVPPEPVPVPGWGMAGIGLAAGLALAGIAALVARALGRKKRDGAPPHDGPAGQVAIEKLHEQGARKSQQDSFFVSPEGSRMLAVVADGMGGLADGDKVSQTAVAAMANGFFHAQGRPGQVLLSLLEQANRAVNNLLGPEGLRHSGSTLVAGLLREGAFHYLSVGDSRICLYRDGALYQLNREHIYRSELYVDGVNGLGSLQDAERHPKGGGLTSYLGMGELKYVDIPAQPVAVRAGDVFVLMSDGVYNALPGEELAGALADPAPADALRAAIQAKGYTNQDNYTAVILRC